MNTGRTSQMLVEARRPRGLSLVEILVTVALLVVIILGLTAMFNQTRKAFTVGLANVDYQDAGRIAMDLITRDLEQMAPSGYGVLANGPNGLYYACGLNFYADVAPPFVTSPANVPWTMLGGDTTNFSLERLLFVTRYNQQWNAIGYRLIPSDATNGGGSLQGVGTLYRYAVNNVSPTNFLGFQFNNFAADPPYPFINANLSRVLDGVVDFRIRTYDRNGVLIPTLIVPFDGGFKGNMTNSSSWLTNLPTAPVFYSTNIYFFPESTGDAGYAFFSNAVPAYVEVELGIMEAPVLAQLQALTNTPSAYLNFLTNHAGQVHIFRQRVTIPAADPAAYP